MQSKLEIKTIFNISRSSKAFIIAREASHEICFLCNLFGFGCAVFMYVRNIERAANDDLSENACDLGAKHLCGAIYNIVSYGFDFDF